MQRKDIPVEDVHQQAVRQHEAHVEPAEYGHPETDAEDPGCDGDPQGLPGDPQDEAPAAVSHRGQQSELVHALAKEEVVEQPDHEREDDRHQQDQEMVDGVEVGDQAVDLPLDVRPVEHPEGGIADQRLHLVVDGLLVPRLWDGHRALVAALKEIVMRHVVERDDTQAGRSADDTDDREGVGETVELVDRVSEVSANPNVTRASDLFGDRDFVRISLWQPAGDDAVVIQRQKLGHARLVESVEVELGVAREQIDVEVRVGIALDKGGARDAGAVGNELVEAGLRGLDRVQARRQTVEGTLELVDGCARRGWDRDIRDAAAGGVNVGGVTVHRLQRLLEAGGIRRGIAHGRLQPPELRGVRQDRLQPGLVLLHVGDQRTRVVGILRQCSYQVFEGFLLRLQALDPNDEIAQRNQIAAEPRGIVAGVGGVDLELLNGRKLRAHLGRQGDDGVVIGGDAAGTVERIDLELYLVQAGERMLQRIRQVLVPGRPRGDEDQLLIAAEGGVGRLTGGGEQRVGNDDTQDRERQDADDRQHLALVPEIKMPQRERVFHARRSHDRGRALPNLRMGSLCRSWWISIAPTTC